MTVAALVVDELDFRFPDGLEVLRHLSVEVDEGERVAILGPNGAGKTTLALHLNGIHELQSGSITVGGLALNDDNLAEIRRRVGMIFQNSDDQLFMPTVREDVGFGPANLGLSKQDRELRVVEALESVGSSHLADRAPHHLSGGEKSRVAIATVLSMRPDLLVLDEPTSDLDPAGRRELVDLLMGLPQTQLVITHDLPFALELCPRSVIISGGQVVADGPTTELLADTALLRANRLELPFGLDPRTLTPRD